MTIHNTTFFPHTHTKLGIHRKNHHNHNFIYIIWSLQHFSIKYTIKLSLKHLYSMSCTTNICLFISNHYTIEIKYSFECTWYNMPYDKIYYVSIICVRCTCSNSLKHDFVVRHALYNKATHVTNVTIIVREIVSIKLYNRSYD